MNDKIIKEFINECISNRRYLGFSTKQMASYLENVSEQDYINFENGQTWFDKDNIRMIINILSVKKPVEFKLDNYIDTTGFSSEDEKFFTGVIKAIEGDIDD